MVPKLLGTRAFTHLVLLSPTSDLTNLAEVPQAQHRELAQRSASNMFHTMVRALATTPSLQKVSIFEMFPWSDSVLLSTLTILYNTTLRELVANSTISHASKITVLGHPSLTISSDSKAEAMFGSSSSRGHDGIHYRGAEGSTAYTNSIIEGLTAAAPVESLPEGWRVQGRQGAATSPADSWTVSLTVTSGRPAVSWSP